MARQEVECSCHPAMISRIIRLFPDDPSCAKSLASRFLAGQTDLRYVVSRTFRMPGIFQTKEACRPDKSHPRQAGVLASPQECTY